MTDAVGMGALQLLPNRFTFIPREVGGTMLALLLAAMLGGCGGGGGASVAARPPQTSAGVTGARDTVTGQATATAEAAVSADGFVDSVGVNVHLHYDGTPYHDAYPAFRSLLLASNVRHIRDSLVDTTWQEYYDRLNDLGRAGIHSELTANPTQSTSMIVSYPARVSDSIEAFEGPNEYDTSGDPAWATTLRNFTIAMSQAVKADPAASRFPIVGPSLTSAGAYAQVGDLSAYVDRGNMHDYFSGRNPGTLGWGDTTGLGTYGSIDFNMHAAGQASGTKPVSATETGYYDGPGIGNTSPPNINGRYLPRLLLEHYLHHVSRTYMYEFFDEGAPGDDHFGLVLPNLTPKPAYTALKSLLGILSDPGAPFTPGSLNYGIEGGTPELHHLLMQKRQGDFYLALWVETPGWDPNGMAETPVPAQDVTLRFGAAVSSVSALRFDDNGTVTTEPVPSLGGAAALKVTDRLTIVSIRR